MRRAGLLALVVLLAVAVVVLSPHGYAVQDRDALLAGASAQHWAGTDALGRDRAVRCAVALLLALGASALAAAGTTAIAAGVGMGAAMSTRGAGRGLMFLSDVFLTLPWLFLLMMVRAGLPLTATPGQSAAVTFGLLAALGWPACARAVYRGSLGLLRGDAMVQGRALGLRPGQLMRTHVLPGLRPLLMAQFLVCVPGFIVAEANLGALGLGVVEPLPSWGGMLAEMGNSALLMRTGWVYLPVCLLVGVLVLLEGFGGTSSGRGWNARQGTVSALD